MTIFESKEIGNFRGVTPPFLIFSSRSNRSNTALHSILPRIVQPLPENFASDGKAPTTLMDEEGAMGPRATSSEPGGGASCRCRCWLSALENMAGETLFSQEDVPFLLTPSSLSLISSLVLIQ